MSKLNYFFQNLPNEARVFTIAFSLFIVAAAMMISTYWLEP
ncbi:hypothetical protein CLV99_4565 [Sphingobacterium yanglingense]|uniref:Uncharacterized protein n=1 Tax=Sphingobacterium yanglingense TaxID=1437280 RepID=A0A4R6W7X0_9SPHI|nr:hypothetical protein CLV99_4565 [Sphingobacterium yanglingense]